MSTTIHILGSGTCMPVPGQKRRAHPGFFIRYGEGDRHLLWECSSNIAERLEAIGVEADTVSQIAVSHAHPDHFAFPHFVQTAFCTRFMRPGFDVKDSASFPKLRLIASEHIIKHLPLLNRVYFEETVEDAEVGLVLPVVEPVALGNGGLITLSGGALLVAYQAYHGFGKVDALAFRLELPERKTIAYSGDTGLCTGIKQVAFKADLFICEASARIGDEKNATGYGHLNPFQAATVAREAGVKRLVLTHYSGVDSPGAMIVDAERSGFAGEILIATDGMMLEV